MAEEANITKEHGWFVGEKKTFEYTVRDEDGAVVDITNHDLEWVLRPAAKSETVFIRKDDDSGGILKTDAQNGVCQVVIMPNDTLIINAGGKFYFTLKRYDGDNDTVLAYGTAELQWGATR